MFVCFIYLAFMTACERERGRHHLSSDLEAGGSRAEEQAVKQVAGSVVRECLFSVSTERGVAGETVLQECRGNQEQCSQGG